MAEKSKGKKLCGAVSQYLEQVKEEATIHGLSHLKTQYERPTKIIWYAIMVSTFSGLSYHFLHVGIEYNRMDTTVEVKIESNHILPFPAVTICNANPIKRSGLKRAVAEGRGNLRLNKLAAPLFSTAKRRKRASHQRANTQTLEATVQSNAILRPPISKNMRKRSAVQNSDGPETNIPTNTTQRTSSTNGQIGELSDAFVQEEKVTYILAQQEDDLKKELGYQMEEMLFDCRFNGHVCDTNSSVSTFSNPYHGNCFTFNSGWNQMAILNSSRTGRRYGLQLTVNVKQTEYIEDAIGMGGAVVLVHSQKEMPFPEDYGVTLTPGEFTLIGLRKGKIIRQAEPYGNCMDKPNNESANAYENLYPVGYSRDACLKTCYQRKAVQLCNCTLPFYPVLQDGEQVPPCEHPEDSSIIDCMGLLHAEISNNIDLCNCPESCREEVFRTTLSTAAWPTVVRTDLTVAWLKLMFPGSFSNVQDDANIMQTNFLTFVVYFEDLNAEVVMENPIYTVSKFMCDIGSVLGLWMGISVVSLAELMEYGLRVVWIFCKTRLPKKIDVKPAL